MQLNGAMLSCRCFVYARNIAGNKRICQFLAHVYKGTRKMSLSIFITIVNDLEIHFQGQKFESRTFVNFNVIISQTVTDMANITIANKYQVVYGL